MASKRRSMALGAAALRRAFHAGVQHQIALRHFLDALLEHEEQIKNHLAGSGPGRDRGYVDRAVECLYQLRRLNDDAHNHWPLDLSKPTFGTFTAHEKRLAEICALYHELAPGQGDDPHGVPCARIVVSHIAANVPDVEGGRSLAAAN